MSSHTLATHSMGQPPWGQLMWEYNGKYCHLNYEAGSVDRQYGVGTLALSTRPCDTFSVLELYAWNFACEEVKDRAFHRYLLCLSTSTGSPDTAAVAFYNQAVIYYAFLLQTLEFLCCKKATHSCFHVVDNFYFYSETFVTFIKILSYLQYTTRAALVALVPAALATRFILCLFCHLWCLLCFSLLLFGARSFPAKFLCIPGFYSRIIWHYAIFA